MEFCYMKICENCGNNDTDEKLLCSKCGSWLKLIPDSDGEACDKVVAKAAVKTLILGISSVLAQSVTTIWFLLRTGFILVVFKPYSYGQYNFKPNILKGAMLDALWFAIPLVLALIGLKNARASFKSIRLYPDRYRGRVISIIGVGLQILSLVILISSLLLAVYWFIRLNFFTD